MKTNILHIVFYSFLGILSNNISTTKVMSIKPIATYEEVKDLPNHPQKLLIDVREPKELQETGQIPTSINIPCKLNIVIN